MTSPPRTAIDSHALVARAEILLDRLELLLPTIPPPLDWKKVVALRWHKRGGHGYLRAIDHPHRIGLDDLCGIDQQKRLVEQNTRQFVQGWPANNVLLTGARGTGKSSLIKALLNKYAARGLRLIEVEKHDLIDLAEIVEQVRNRPERFVLYCDDLSFEADDAGYKALKVVLDGSIAAASENVLIYATSNRRHLMPEYMQENLDYRHVGEEIHPGETVEEKISLSERFGLWVSFYSFDQDDYLSIVAQWVGHLSPGAVIDDDVRRQAVQWALARGSRSGRVAWQFARDFAGRIGMKQRRHTRAGSPASD